MCSKEISDIHQYDCKNYLLYHDYNNYNAMIILLLLIYYDLFMIHIVSHFKTYIKTLIKRFRFLSFIFV